MGEQIVATIAGLVGHTPLLELSGYEKRHGLKARILAKLEWFNPTGSIKDRAAIAMIEDAERDGRLKPGDTIVEQTSGNTGIALAAFAAAKGYPVKIFLEKGASLERRLLLEAYGAQLLTYKDAIGADTPDSATNRAAGADAYAGGVSDVRNVRAVEAWQDAGSIGENDAGNNSKNDFKNGFKSDSKSDCKSDSRSDPKSDSKSAEPLNGKPRPWTEPEREATLEEIYAYCARQPVHHYFINQVTNESNPQAHIRTTGPEIWEQTGGKVDVLVCMAGTGGTADGLSRYLREKNPNVLIAVAQPAHESRLSENPHAEIIDGVLPFDGIPAEDVSGFIGKDVYDLCFDVSTEQAFRTARELALTDGVLPGTSSAAALFAAAELAKKTEYAGKNIVVIMPDDALKYLSTGMFRDLAK